ncbi:type IV secretion protein Rhs [Microbacterium marinilacus]|uniref:RHS repeat-associated core domain-containing protein n=1 Tax=Microbacterium marinilacus TaxID=415209 RepID=A0ABP7BNU8_9MICO|nr:type IV secretion protein Rhs [Microbacterium marinilacus]MBY0690355.1 type IV secretion protein Rhs [Microbacterium marinilacus]
MRAKILAVSALVTASTLAVSLVAVPPASAADELGPEQVAEQLLSEAGLDYQDWVPQESGRGPVNTDVPADAWRPREAPDADKTNQARQAAKAPDRAIPTTGGTGDLPGYTFMEFPFFDANGGTSIRVNVGSGNLLIQETEAAVAGPGVGLEVQRVFNSIPAPFGDISERWATSLGSLGLVGTATSNDAHFYGPTGYIAKFTRSGSTWTAPAGLNASLSFGANGVGTVRFNRTGLTYKFTNGYATSITDRNGVGLTLSYDDRGIQTVTNATGDTVWFDYIGGVGNAWVRQIEDGPGRSTNFEHGSVPGILGSTTSFARGDWSIESDVDNRDRPNALERSDGKRIEFEYAQDASGKVTKVTQKAPGFDDVVTEFDYTASGTVVTDPRGGTSAYEIDDQNRVTSAEDQLGRTRSQTWTPNSDVATSTDAIGSNVTTSEYDDLNNLTSVSLPTGAATQAIYAQGPNCPNAQAGNPYQPKCAIDPAGNTSSMEYDAAGNLTKQSDTTSGTTSVQQYAYENSSGSICGGFAGQVCTATDANGNVTSYEYTAGNVTKVDAPAPLGDTTYQYDGLNRLTSVTDGNGHTTAYGYDNRDRVTSTTYNDGSVVLSAWNLDGTLAGTSDSKIATVQSFEHDLLGQITSQTTQSSTPGVISSAATMTHDAAGNLLSHSDVTGTTQYSYDAASQLTRLVEPGGACPTSGTPGANSGCILFDYDENGQESKRTLPGGATTVTNRDDSGRPTRVTAKTGAGATAVDIGYSYAAPGSGDDLANVQSRTAYKEEGITAGAVTTYSYNERNRLTLAEERIGANVSASWKYAYDGAGNRTSQTRAGATGAAAGTTNYSYNAAHQLTSVTGQSTTFTYDGAGNQTRNGLSGVSSSFGDRLQAASAGSTSYSYLAGGNSSRLTSGGTSFVNTPLGATQESAGNTVMQYTYSPQGQPIGYRAAARWYYVQDLLGSVVGVFSASGTYAGGYSYSPYGEARSTGTATAVTANPIRYIGGHHESGGERDPVSRTVSLC